MTRPDPLGLGWETPFGVPLPSEEGTTSGFQVFCLLSGQNLALTVLHVPYSLDSGTPRSDTNSLISHNLLVN